MSRTKLALMCAVLAAGLSISAQQTSAVRFEKIYPLKAEEGVFAYARISPDGQTLAYASIMPDMSRPVVAGRPPATRTTQTVVDLKT